MRVKYSDLMIPERYRNAKLFTLTPATLNQITKERQAKVISILQENPLVGYIFLGPTGVGKTHMMWSLVNHAIMDGRKVVAMTCSQFIKQARESEFDRNLITPLSQELIEEYTRVDIPIAKSLHVFLDELDKIKLSEFSQLLLFDIVNAAYDYPDRIKITITSNLTPQKFEEVYGAAFYRKLSTISRLMVYSSHNGDK